MLIRLNMVGKIIELARSRPAVMDLAMLCLAGYTFLLRVPSEGIPIAAHRGASATAHVFRIHDESVELWLHRRWNRLHPSSIFRKCWSKADKTTCPVHVLGEYFKGLAEGVQPFGSMSGASVLEGLRGMLQLIEVPSAMSYRTQDLRRGHAEEMRIKGPLLVKSCVQAIGGHPRFCIIWTQSN